MDSGMHHRARCCMVHLQLASRGGLMQEAVVHRSFFSAALSSRSVVARSTAVFMAGVLLLSALLKVINPTLVLDAVVALGGVVGLDIGVGLGSGLAAGLVFVEVLIGLLLVAVSYNRLLSIATVALFSFFFVVLVVLRVYAPGVDCGCGLPGASESGTSGGEMFRGVAFLMIALLHELCMGGWFDRLFAKRRMS